MVDDNNRAPPSNPRVPTKPEEVKKAETFEERQAAHDAMPQQEQEPDEEPVAEQKKPEPPPKKEPSTPPPAISVIMSVYNAEDVVAEAIESILAQTFKNFEFIIIDDGSVDDTFEVLKYYGQQDKRIRIIRQKNTGLTAALNRGIEKARGVLIARQDADDKSVPDRFEKQVAFMQAHPDILVLGSNSKDVRAEEDPTEWGFHYEEELAGLVFMQTPFPHSTVMMRADACKELGGYDVSYKTAQDMELWMRMAKKGRIAMLQDQLIERTIAEGSISAKRRWRQFYDASRARWKHNPLPEKPAAMYMSLRGLLIALMPYSTIKTLKELKSDLKEAKQEDTQFSNKN